MKGQMMNKPCDCAHWHVAGRSFATVGKSREDGSNDCGSLVPLTRSSQADRHQIVDKRRDGRSLVCGHRIQPCNVPPPGLSPDVESRCRIKMILLSAKHIEDYVCQDLFCFALTANRQIHALEWILPNSSCFVRNPRLRQATQPYLGATTRISTVISGLFPEQNQSREYYMYVLRWMMNQDGH